MNATFGKKKRKEEVGFQLAPMIDMTFLLLVFFMVTTKITRDQMKMIIALPVAFAAKQPDDLSGRDIINVDAEGQIFAGERPLSSAQLKTYLKQRLIDVPPLRIYVRADANTDVKIIKQIMGACAEAGAIEVIFGSHREK
jgi:biopolymer transport protein ExbD